MHPQKKGKKRVPERVQVLHLEVFSSASQLTGKNKPKKKFSGNCTWANCLLKNKSPKKK